MPASDTVSHATDTQKFVATIAPTRPTPATRHASARFSTLLPPRSTWFAHRIIAIDASAYTPLVTRPTSKFDRRPSLMICGSQMPTPYDPTRNPNCTPARISRRTSLSAGSSWRISLCFDSPATLSRMSCRSRSVNHVASSGRSVNTRSTPSPTRVTGNPSRMNSHFQPARPRMPFICRSAPDSAPPTTEEMGIATMNHAMTRVRYSAGNQWPR